MAEFWWGQSPASEIRKHQNFYPSCNGKCKPILNHMLNGIDVDPNPLLICKAKNKPIEIIYEDENILLINKPSDLLSVPGKNIKDSVYNRIKQKFPMITGPIIVHRLDMSTSGLMIITKNKGAHKHLQKQFINHKIKKKYTAILDGEVSVYEGEINLPIRLDIDDRPRQLVCDINGKPSRTKWKVLEIKNKRTKICFEPITGRTHQLRVHSAHIRGLNIPILGDDLYGKSLIDYICMHNSFNLIILKQMSD
jgi:tRNA pseudouridine32 synthase/23S rRNA pseudouridine746 synthase